MAYATIIVEKLDAVARLTLNRPERVNALNRTMLEEIGAALDQAEHDPDVRVVIVRGAGSAFSSGFDLKEQMERPPRGVEEWRPVLRQDFDTIMRFWHFPRPTIAAVRGPCLAAALALARHIAAIDPDLVKQTKRAINRAYEAQNMLAALEEALAIDLGIEGAGSPDKAQFMEIARRDGLKAALAWRDARFARGEP